MPSSKSFESSESAQPEPHVLDEVSANLAYLLSTASVHHNGEFVTNYTVKPAAVHRMLRALDSAGFHVRMPVDIVRALNPGPQDQSILHGDNNQGDCWRACIATILGRTVDTVPHFALLGVNHFITTTLAWLVAEGYEASIQIDDYRDQGLKPMGQHIIRGISPRGIAHSVVGDTLTGDMLHDPHPSREGLKEITSRLYLFPVYRDSSIGH